MNYSIKNYNVWHVTIGLKQIGNMDTLGIGNQEFDYKWNQGNN